MSTGAERPRRGLGVARLFGELVVIVVGVLLALAADRWNQARGQEHTRQEYVDRLVEEIREDSLQMEAELEQLRHMRSAQDTLMAALDGDLPINPDGSSLRRAGQRVVLRPVMAWTELNSTGLLALIDDGSQRRALAEYYAKRSRTESALNLVEGRTRDPYFDVLHPLGLLDGEIEQAEVLSFLRHPEAKPLVRGLRSLAFANESFLGDLLEAAGLALEALETGSTGGSA